MRPQYATIALAVALTTAAVSLARADEVPLEVHIVQGRIDPDGSGGLIQLRATNQTELPLRLVGLIVDYDTASGSTVTFTATDALDVTVAPNDTIEGEYRFATEFAQGEFFEWPHPYTIEPVVGADMATMRELVAEANNADRIERSLDQMGLLLPVMRRAQERHAERIGGLADGADWFDHEGLVGLRPDLEQALCLQLGRTISRARGGEARVDAYLAATRRLSALSLYPSCMEREDRMTAARAMVATERAQDVLVLTERDADGQVLPEWREVYLAGRVALAELAIQGETMQQFRPGIQSINELRRLSPDHPRLADLADQLLHRMANRVDRLIEEEMELTALEVVEQMREEFADHAATERASVATANALVVFAQRSLAGGHPIRANNAFVRGLNILGELPVWQTAGPAIQAARRDHQLAKTRSAIGDGRYDEAEEALRDAQQLARIEPAELASLEDAILLGRWENLDALVSEANYEGAVAQADELVANAERPEVLGDAQDELYLDVADAIWDRYGFLSGIASRTRIGLAEGALAKGRAADPALADSLATKFFIARWLFPGLIFFVVLLVAAIVLLRGSWRRQRRARRLWRAGVKRAETGEFTQAADLLDRAYELLARFEHPAEVVGEDSRGHLVLRIAGVQAERGRKDKLKEMAAEWTLLEDWERPYNEDFFKALGEYRSAA